MTASSFTKQAQLHDGTPIDVSEMTPGRAVREARLRAGLTLEDLSRASGLSAGQISRIENGRTERPGGITLAAIARGLNRSQTALEFLAWPHRLEEMYADHGSLHDELSGEVPSPDDFEEECEQYRVVAWVAFVEARRPEDEGHGVEVWADQLPGAGEVLRQLVLLPKERREKVLGYLNEQWTLWSIESTTKGGT